MFSMFKKKKQERLPTLAIGAIFKNECDYVLEWLAWHRAQGFSQFIIYDNGSDDGTLALLTSLDALHYISLRTIEGKEGAQVEAYQAILDNDVQDVDYLAFIDADEFLVPDGRQSAADHLSVLFSDASVGAVGVNWRIYGTAGQEKQEEGFVIERFQQAASDQRSRNHFLKSVYRPEAVQTIFVHRAVLKKGYEYVNTQGDALAFANYKQGIAPVKEGATTGVALNVCDRGLRVNHYALKSYDEFLRKKKYKGDAVQGQGHVRSDSYFKEFDLNDEHRPIDPYWYDAMKAEYDKLVSQLSAVKDTSTSSPS